MDTILSRWRNVVFGFVFDSTEQKNFGAGLSIGNTSIDLSIFNISRRGDIRSIKKYYHGKLIASFNPDFVSHI